MKNKNKVIYFSKSRFLNNELFIYAIYDNKSEIDLELLRTNPDYIPYVGEFVPTERLGIIFNGVHEELVKTPIDTSDVQPAERLTSLRTSYNGLITDMNEVTSLKELIKLSDEPILKEQKLFLENRIKKILSEH